MKRKYRFRKYYAVVYYDYRDRRYRVEENMTLKEARVRARYLFNCRNCTFSCIDIIKRVWSWRKYHGVVDLEAL